MKALDEIKLFFWSASYESLPMKPLLHRRGMAFSTLCYRCNDHVGDVLHCLKNLPSLSLLYMEILGVYWCCFLLRATHSLVAQKRSSSFEPSDFCAMCLGNEQVRYSSNVTQCWELS